MDSMGTPSRPNSHHSVPGTTASAAPARGRFLRPVDGETLPEPLEKEFNGIVRYEFRRLLYRERGVRFPDPRDQELKDLGATIDWRLAVRRREMEREAVRGPK